MLYIWMPEANGVWQWSRGENWVQAESLDQLIHEIKIEKTEEATVFFPSRDVQILQQSFTKTQYKQLGGDGLKYLLEEFVIVPIDQMRVFSHFQQPDQVFVMGIAQNSVLTLQHSLALLPVKVISLLPDFLILPIPEVNQTLIANINGRLLVRESEYLGNSIDDLAFYFEFPENERKYKYSGLSDTQLESLFAIAPSDLCEYFDASVVDIKKPKNHPYNVLPQSKKTNQTLSGYWKACVVILLALVLVQLSYDVLRWYKLKKVADQTALIAVDQYKSWFGKNERVDEESLQRKFKTKLDLSSGVNTQALQLLSRVGPILMQHQIVANRINYDAHILNMDLAAKSADSLQNLVKQLNQQGFKAELGNVKTQESTVIGLVKIQ